MRTLTILILSFFVFSCDQLTRIQVDVEAEQEIEGSLISAALGSLGFNDFVSFDVSSSAEFENNDATRANIGESYVSMFYLEVLSPDDQTLSFIDEMQVFIGDGDTRTEIAYIEAGTDTDVSSLYFAIPDGKEIGQYLRSESTTIDVEASGRSPNVDTRIKATIRFSIELQF